MTITEAIKRLAAIKTKYGNVAVYFDCPFCGKVFAPNNMETHGVHLSADIPPMPDE